ncbi:acylneuraminate cytidylyltransferase family protein [Nitrospinae bacterium AH_259_B05_G02_I21]|nr:acylneuraminate cytidylyltransferase family protein [Nitrospinae bacterium AH_259_B05_G02_I21]
MSTASVLGVVTARGGSRALPRKNILPLAGKPVIAYTIEASHGCDLIDRVIVSTDDEEIAEVARTWGAEVPFIRPAELATDTAHHPDVMQHAVAFIEAEQDSPVDLVLTLQPTSPLRTADHLRQGIERIRQTGAGCLVSVREACFPPFWMFAAKGDRLKTFVEHDVDYFTLERQQLPRVYQANGAVYVTRRDILMEGNKLVVPEDIAYIVMDEESSLEIDTALEFRLIELILNEWRQDEA